MLKYNCVNSKKIEYAQFFLVYGKEQKLKKISLTDFQKGNLVTALSQFML